MQCTGTVNKVLADHKEMPWVEEKISKLPYAIARFKQVVHRDFCTALHIWVVYLKVLSFESCSRTLGDARKHVSYRASTL